jgi:carboxypeptidase D
LELLPADYWVDGEAFPGNFTSDGGRRLSGNRGTSSVRGSSSSSSNKGGKEEKPSANANDYLVSALPGLKPGDYPHRQWAGHLAVDPKHGGYLFYWLFEAWEGAADPATPLVVWLNGGPACTSMDGLFLENGPFKLSDRGDLEVNPYAWAKHAHLLYIDQPVGTGLSFVGDSKAYPRNDGDVNRALLAFFDGLQALHAWLPGRKVFLTGESHAGHYLPSLAQALLLRADKQQSSTTKPPANEVVVVGGVAIGNGWFDP